MASIVRKIMRGIIRAGNRHQMTNGAALGSHRAGMHQAAEHEYRRRQMAEALPPEEESVEEALEMPAAVEEEIPPVEEEDDEIVEEIAEGDAGLEADTEILEEVADPEASIEEEETGGEEVTEETLAVDYSAERIPVLDYSVTGSSDPETPLEYTSQDGTPKEIQEPLPGMAEAYGVAPYVQQADEVISAPSEDVEFTIDGEGDLVVG